MKSLLTNLAFLIAFATAQPQRVDAADFGRIMPLGDSITAGYTSTGGVPGGYREELVRNLSAAGHSFSLVGSQTTYPSEALTSAGQEHHEGHNGYTIAQITDGVVNSNWLGVDPDIILLHIGANDMLTPEADTAPDRLDALLDNIIARRPEAQILVAKIIGGSTVVNGAQAAEYDQAIAAYNLAVAEIVGVRADDGQHVSLVDMYGLLNITRQTDDLGRPLFADTSHPNQLGYDVMGNAWDGAIESVAMPEPSCAAIIIAGLVCLAAFRSCGRMCQKERK